MRFLPSQDYLLIEEVNEARASGIVLPENVTLEWRQGRIKDIGPGKYSLTGELVSPNYDVGDIVVFSGQAAMDIEVSGEKFKIISSNNVFGVLETDDEVSFS